jgi:rhodanese-related sulfurtransferase
MREWTPAECQDYLQQGAGNPLLLDVRENSRLAPMREIPAEATDLDPGQETIVICHHGIRSRKVAWFQESRDFSNVINLRGGLDAWARELDPLLTTY